MSEENKKLGPKERAEMDQLIPFLSEYYAGMTGGYFRQLIELQGFTRQEALTLTVAFITAQVGQSRDT